MAFWKHTKDKLANICCIDFFKTALDIYHSYCVFYFSIHERNLNGVHWPIMALVLFA